MAVLMMIAITIAGSLVVYAWAMGYIDLSTEKSEKAITVHSIANHETDLLVYVQNTGEGVVQLEEGACLYVNGELVECRISGVTVSEGVATIDEGKTAILTFEDGVAPPGEKVEIKVTTLHGGSSEYSDHPAGTAHAPSVLDHFTFDPISSPQTSGVSFSIMVRAVDQYGKQFAGYNGVNTLTCSAGEITPTSTESFLYGFWSGEVTVTGSAANAAITTFAQSNTSWTGASNTFNVTAVPDDYPANTIVVPDDYATIQEAINHATDGDTIVVKSGTYYESVVVNKTLTLKGIDYPVVNAQKKYSAITIRAPSCVVDGFKLTQGAQQYGEGGIRIDYYSGGGNIIRNNIAYGNIEGIYALKTSNNTIINNTCYNNTHGIKCWVEGDDYIANNTIYSNRKWGLLLSNTQRMTVEGNIIYNHTTEPDGQAIFLDGCYDSIVRNNHLFNNRCGIYTTYAGSGNIITENRIINNEIGTSMLPTVGGNQIYHNAFINNTQQANWSSVPLDSPATNTWNADYPLGGNFWSDYAGGDSDGDGIGDTPYFIYEGNQDNYPLMNPWND